MALYAALLLLTLIIGLWRVLRQKPTLAASIKAVCIKHPEKPRAAPSWRSVATLPRLAWP